jgi:hypothetical protein
MDATELEMLVDVKGLAGVLSMLAEIAYAKEDHLLSNWQDKAAARLWRNAGKAIEKTAACIEV